MKRAVPRIALTAGEPSGVGPDLCIELSQRGHAAEIVVFGDPDTLRTRARLLDIPLELQPVDLHSPPRAQRAGFLHVSPVPLRTPASCGQLEPANSVAVLQSLREAAAGCMTGDFDAMVTAPVHKGIINDAGFAFSGHTEFLAELTGTAHPVMLLVAGSLRVALVTTHLPLARVAREITPARLQSTLRVLDAGLASRFGLTRARITVLGLNPHAGEGGHLGSEETHVIEPVIRSLCAEGMNLTGPLPADTAFTPSQLERCDAVLAMYHDQGLPVLKYAGFGRAVNVTLGLPILRTSVDHGTALDLAGTGRADVGSLEAALAAAMAMIARQSSR